jgi:sodium-coupled neutral amino acid transporter 11
MLLLLFPPFIQDMADLSITSRINVIFDIIMVMLVLYCAPIKESWAIFEWRKSIIHYDTIFVGLGVLSFAFVCQHSAFIIAGSLEKPTKVRWARVTRTAISVCCSLALVCGVGGFVGFQGATEGNILNSLDNSLPANIARALLGTTMLFVYPMESFVARHVCVVLFFQGRSAHEGDDTSVLNRRDRRVTLTFLLYLIAAIPAALFQDVGIVLAVSGAIGGSCLSYIGPGAVYLGIHGARFLEISKSVFGRPAEPMESEYSNDELEPLYSKPVSANLEPPHQESWIVRTFKDACFYLLLMPVWCKIAQTGKNYLTSHITELALQTPHPIRIGNVRFAPVKIRGGSTRVVMLPRNGPTSGDQSSSDVPITTTLIRSDSLPHGISALRAPDGQIVALPSTPTQGRQLLPPKKVAVDKGYQSINQQVGAMAARRAKEEQFALEDDPQQIPPAASDFVIALFYIMFGLLAMVAGLISIFAES